MIERTVLEIAQHRFWAWQRRTAPTPRSQLRETDRLLGAVEECRLREIKLIPTPIWRPEPSRLLRLLRATRCQAYTPIALLRCKAA